MLVQNRLWLHIKHDLRVGVAGQWIKYLVTAIIFSVLNCSLLVSIEHIKRFSINDGIKFTSSPNLGDFLYYNYRGMREFLPNDKDFQINAFFLLINLFLAYIVSFYPFKDLLGYGQKMLLSSQKRSYWWISKCIWNITSVLCFYGTTYIIMSFFSLFTGGLSLLPHLEILQACCSVSLQSVDIFSVLMAGVLLPILISICISLFQMTVSLIFKPIIGIIVVASILVISIFYLSGWIPGNYLMIQRNSLFISGSGVDLWKGILLSFLISIASILIGLYYFMRCDILSKLD